MKRYNSSVKIKPRKNYNTNFKQKISTFRVSSIDHLHYMNTRYLETCLTHLKSIVSRKVTSHNQRYQRRMSEAIKVSRFLGLLPYTT